jgi:TonB family protein
MIGSVVVAFLVLCGPATLDASGPQAAAQQPPPAQETWPPANVVRMGKAITSPAIVKETKPGYTADAMRAKIQGTVELEAIVLIDGSVGEVRVVRSLDKEYGLDEQAVKALKQWRFKPGMKDGVAVPVLVTVEMSFSIRDKR